MQQILAVMKRRNGRALSMELIDEGVKCGR